MVEKAKEYKGDFDLADLKYDFDTHFKKDDLTISLTTIHKILKENQIVMRELKPPKDFKSTPEVTQRYFEIRKQAALKVAQILADDGILGVFYDEVTFVNFQGKTKVYTFSERDLESYYEARDR